MKTDEVEGPTPDMVMEKIKEARAAIASLKGFVPGGLALNLMSADGKLNLAQMRCETWTLQQQSKE